MFLHHFILINFAFFIFLISVVVDCKSANLIREPSEEYLEKLGNLGENDLAEEYSGQYQGDILISEEQMRKYKTRKPGKNLIDKSYRWNNEGGGKPVVPYEIKDDHFSREQVRHIKYAIMEIQSKTCVTFVPYNRKKHKDYISVVAEYRGCFSFVGRQGGEQIINLQQHKVGSGCFRLFTIVHEFLHALGFFHMQAATNRDEFVEIRFKSVIESQKSSFDKYGSSMIANFETDYDFSSVMHFSSTAFSMDGIETIQTLNNTKGEEIGQRRELSPKDIARVNSMYCNETSNKLIESTYRGLLNFFG